MVRLEELNRTKEEVAKAADEKSPVTCRSSKQFNTGENRTSALLIMMVSRAFCIY